MVTTDVMAAKEAAEKTLGFEIPSEIAQEVLAYAVRKCELNKKPESYLPILYENELTDYYMRLAINSMSAMRREAVCHV